MQRTIGDATGIVWKYLKTHGPTSATKLAIECELDNRLVQRALGWLARENKLVLIQKGRSELIDLKES